MQNNRLFCAVSLGASYLSTPAPVSAENLNNISNKVYKAEYNFK